MKSIINSEQFLTNSLTDNTIKFNTTTPDYVYIIENDDYRKFNLQACNIIFHTY